MPDICVKPVTNRWPRAKPMVAVFALGVFGWFAIGVTSASTKTTCPTANDLGSGIELSGVMYNGRAPFRISIGRLNTKRAEQLGLSKNSGIRDYLVYHITYDRKGRPPVNRMAWISYKGLLNVIGYNFSLKPASERLYKGAVDKILPLKVGDRHEFPLRVWSKIWVARPRYEDWDSLASLEVLKKSKVTIGACSYETFIIRHSETVAAKRAKELPSSNFPTYYRITHFAPRLGFWVFSGWTHDRNAPIEDTSFRFDNKIIVGKIAVKPYTVPPRAVERK